MQKTTKLIIAIIAVAIIAGGAVVLANKKSDQSNSETTTPSTNQTDKSSQSAANNGSTAANEVAITYNGESFTLSASTIAAGGKITVTNNSSQELQFESNPHPAHTDNPELNVGDVDAGQSKTATLTTKGTWGFHNHYNHNQGGQITVQ